jgi:hypothetical protein
MSSVIKLCKNCRHFVNDSPLLWSPQFGKCRLARSETPQTTDPVDGRIVNPSVTFSHATTERKWGTACGMDGLRYEREPDNMQVLRNMYAAPALGAAKNTTYVAAWLGCLAYVTLKMYTL